MTVEVLDWGCVIRSILVPDRDGVPTDVVLGYDDLSGYESGSCFFGAFVGRLPTASRARPLSSTERRTSWRKTTAGTTLTASTE